MFSFNNVFNQVKNSSENNNKSLFGNNKSLFADNNNNFTQRTDLFGNSKNNFIFDNNNNNNNTANGLFKTTLTTGLSNNSLFSTINNNNLGLFNKEKENNNQEIFNKNFTMNNKTLFLNNNEKEKSIWDNKFNQNNSLFNTNEENSLFKKNTTNPNSGLFSNSIFEQKGLFNNNSLFTTVKKDNEDNKNGSLFSNIFADNNKSLFNDNNKFLWIGNNKDDKKNTSLFVQNDKGKSLFNNSLFNNTLTTGPIKTETNKQMSLFQNFNNDSNKNNIFLFPATNNTVKSLFENKDENKVNINNEGQVFNAQKNNNDNMINNGLFGQTNCFSTSLFSEVKKNDSQQLQGNIPNNQINNNDNSLNKTMNNNEMNNYDLSEHLTLNDIVDPLQYLSSSNNIKASTPNIILSQKIEEAVQKQKTLNQFLEDLEEKYNNKENINDNDILDNYGTYLGYTNKNDNYKNELDLLNNNNSYRNSKTKIRKVNETKNQKIYNMKEMTNTLSKVNSIYEEYNRYKNKFQKNLIKNKSDNNDNNIIIIINNLDNKYETKTNIEENDIIGRNESLYQKNMMKFDKLTDNQIKTDNNNNKENCKTKKGKVINDNGKTKENNSKEKNISKNVELTIKNNLSNKKDDNLDEKNSNNLSIKEENKDNNNIGEKLVPLELVPRLTKEGYKCIPSIIELSRKTKDELKKVEGFKIFNQYGEVEFMEPVNLIGLDLDNQITIEPNIIETGDELEYNSKFKLYSFKIEENGLNKYKMNIEKVGGKLLEYKNNEIVWEYKKKIEL